MFLSKILTKTTLLLHLNKRNCAASKLVVTLNHVILELFHLLVMAPAQKLYNVVSVLGPPGSGKGTQCVKIMKILASCTYQQEIFYALNVNDKALNWSADRAPYYEWDNCACRNHLQTVGKRKTSLVPSFRRNTAMDAAGDAKGFLVDSFPRNQNNLERWEQQMKKKVNVKFVLFLSCPVDVCISRCLHRGQGRTDDNEESLRKRIETYNSQTLSIIQHYEKLGLVKEVPSDKSPEEVYLEVENVFKKGGL
ncbi:UMP-CMP kinase [Trichostrongylus colubriformis]|uniref:UMP-CMP kinase n=1 Tax=Trichostrongylus colubriformis TaxID=6319 RepID=A0AAN8G4X3_TRICO